MHTRTIYYKQTIKYYYYIISSEDSLTMNFSMYVKKLEILMILSKDKKQIKICSYLLLTSGEL